MAASRNDSAVLGANTTFVARVQASLLSAVINISSEGNAIANHSFRLALVHQILSSPSNLAAFATMFALSVATDSNVLADATAAGTVALTTSNILTQQALSTDAHIDTAVSSQFNAYCSGIPA